MNLQKEITNYFDAKESSDNGNKAVDQTLKLLESGEIRIAEKKDGRWIVNEWVKQAILLAFRYKNSGKQEFDSFDKLGLLKYDYDHPNYRKVPLSLIREGVYIGESAVIMPSYINIGAYIGSKTMIDINATIGSCAQIGENCHIAASAVIGGVLEPLNANPVIVENNCFIGANSSVLEGVIVEEGAVVAPGVSITSSTKIIDRESGSITFGTVPARSVVVAGSYQSKNGINISCAVIVKKVDDKTKTKARINDILRDL